MFLTMEIDDFAAKKSARVILLEPLASTVIAIVFLIISNKISI